jgi:hypothetical protein
MVEYAFRYDSDVAHYLTILRRFHLARSASTRKVGEDFRRRFLAQIRPKLPKEHTGWLRSTYYCWYKKCCI